MSFRTKSSLQLVIGVLCTFAAVIMLWHLPTVWNYSVNHFNTHFRVYWDPEVREFRDPTLGSIWHTVLTIVGYLLGILLVGYAGTRLFDSGRHNRQIKQTEQEKQMASQTAER